jgi:folate-binding Fe-S cluster repair protein YgfZ
MTETATSQAIQANRPTPLATLLAQVATLPGAVKSERANCEQLAAPQVPYRGCLTPRELDAPGRETAALISAAAAHDLGWLRRVAVRGEDRFRWLSGMVTNTINDLGENAGTWNLVLNAQGRIQGDLYVWREGDSLTLTIAADQYDRLLSHLERFIIMDDVELAPLSVYANGELSEDSALGLSGPLAAGVLARLGLPAPAEPLTSARAAERAALHGPACNGPDGNGSAVRVVRGYGVLAPHYEIWTRAAEIPALWQALTEAGAIPVGAATLEAFRIAEGIPAYGIDIAERDLPQEAVPQVAALPGAIKSVRAKSEQLAPPQVVLSFNKGCYLGQEIVERIRSRGSVHRHLRQLEIFGPVPAAGTELTTDDGSLAGKITSAAELLLPNESRIFALGMMRGEAELHNQLFTYTDGAVTGTAWILAAPPKLESAGKSASQKFKEETENHER